MQDRQLPFWILAVTFGAAFLLPHLAGEGIHFDGEIYATLSRNLAEGLGTPWAPYLNHSDPIWNEHPPLGLWIMSVGYRVFGDHLVIERIHTFLTVLAAGWLLVLLWREIFREDTDLRQLGWLPLLFWLANPQVTWAYRNAMLENTSSLFVLAALLALARGWRADRFPWRMSAVAGVAIFAAALTKGPVGLYPVAAPVLAVVVQGRPDGKRGLGMTLVTLGTATLAFGLLWQLPAARENLEAYVSNQLGPSLASERGGEVGFLKLAGNLIETNLTAILLGALLIFAARWRFGAAAWPGPRLRTGLLWIAIGLAGSLPLGLSPRQSLFYCLPSFPATAIGLAALAAPAVHLGVRAIRPGGRVHRTWRGVAAILAAAVLLFSATRLGGYARNAELRADIDDMVEYLVGQGIQKADICGHLQKDWTMQMTFSRVGNVDTVFPPEGLDHLITLDGCGDPDPAVWDEVGLKTVKIHLHRRIR